MKRFFIAVTALMVVVNGAFASAELVKQKAQHIRDVNNQQQGITPSAPAPAPSPGASMPNAPASGGLAPAQQALIDRLETDLTAIKPGSTVTAQAKLGLQTDMATLAKGANQPSKAQLAKLSADLANALADKSVSAHDLGQLSKAINIIVNCTLLTPTRAQAYVTAAQGILKASGVNEENLLAITSDLKAIVMEIQKSKPKLYQ